MQCPYSLFEITQISKEHMKSSKISKNIKKIQFSHTIHVQMYIIVYKYIMHSSILVLFMKPCSGNQ